MLIIFIIICRSLILPCVFQAWIIVRFWSKWSEGTGCRVPRIAPSHCTSWCCSAGKGMLKSGPPSSTCKPSWRTILQPLSLNTSLGTTSKNRPSHCWQRKSGALPARTYRDVSLLQLRLSFFSSTMILKHMPWSLLCLTSPPVPELYSKMP